MEFFLGTPALLYGLAAVSVPVVIHLLLRQRPRLAEFPALQFLRAGVRSQRARLRLKHLLLLLLRMTILALLALAMSRPIVRSTLFAPSAHRTAQVILVIDDSYSMGYKSNGTARLDAAKEEAARLLGTLALGSHAALLTTSRPFGDFTIDIAALAEQVRGLRLTATDHPLWPTLEATRNLTPPDPAQPVETYVLTDMTRQAWRRPPNATLGLGSDAVLTVIDVGDPEARDLAVVAIDPPGTTTAQNRTLELTMTVRSQGVRGPRTLALYLNGVRRANWPLSLSGDEQLSERYRYTFRTPGVHQGRAEVVEGDGLLMDNQRYFTVVVGGQPSLLMVSGPPGPTGADELYFAHLALNPGGFAQAAPFKLERLSPDKLPGAVELARKYQVVLLANVPSLPAHAWSALSHFVLGGGGLAVFLGGAVEAENYNTYAGDLLPGGIGPAVDFPEEARLVVPSFAHPLVASFADGRNGDLSAATFTRARRLALLESADVELVATFEPGGTGAGIPAWAVRRVGQGRVACFTSTIDNQWTDFPKWPAYLPFQHELAKFLSRTYAREHNFQVGEVARVQLPGPEAGPGRDLSIGRPGAPDLLPLSVAPGERTLVFTDTDRVGNYTIFMEREGDGLQAISGFSVNLNPEEGDLSRVAAEELSSVLPEMQVVGSIEELPEVWAQAGRGGTRELSAWLLTAALVGFLMETWFSNRFYPS